MCRPYIDTNNPLVIYLRNIVCDQSAKVDQKFNVFATEIEEILELLGKSQSVRFYLINARLLREPSGVLIGFFLKTV